MKQIKHLRNRRYNQQVCALRRTVNLGVRVNIIRGLGEIMPGIVANIRSNTHGSIEVYVVADNDKFMGWVPVDMILPEKLSR